MSSRSVPWWGLCAIPVCAHRPPLAFDNLVNVGTDDDEEGAVPTER